MEDPTTWTPVHHVINDAINQFHENMEMGLCGSSIVACVYDALRDKGYLNFLSPDVMPIKKETEHLDFTPTCNRHDDCEAADQKVRDAQLRDDYGQLRTRSDHCYSDDCEDCFGK